MLGTLGAATGGAIGLGIRGDRIDKLSPLQSLVDTIVPSDDFVGALGLGLDQRLASEMQQKPRTNERIERLLVATNKQALKLFQSDFHKLNLNQREQLLTEVLLSDRQVVFKSDLNRIRRKIIRWYYTSEDGQASLDYASPGHYPTYAGSRPF